MRAKSTIETATLPKPQTTRTTTSKTKTNSELSPKTLRDRLDSYYELALKIYNSNFKDVNSISQLPLDQAILDLELALGVKIIKERLSISQHPLLTEDFEGNYPRKWRLIIKASDLLCALYNLRSRENDNKSDEYRTELLKEFCKTIRHLKGSQDPCPDRETNGIRSRLRNLSTMTGIGREKFNTRIEDKQLLALSIWIAKEHANNLNPMPDFYLSEMIERPIPKLVTAASVGATAWIRVGKRDKQGLLFV